MYFIQYSPFLSLSCVRARVTTKGSLIRILRISLSLSSVIFRRAITEREVESEGGSGRRREKRENQKGKDTGWDRRYGGKGMVEKNVPVSRVWERESGSRVVEPNRAARRGGYYRSRGIVTLRVRPRAYGIRTSATVVATVAVAREARSPRRLHRLSSASNIFRRTQYESLI